MTVTDGNGAAGGGYDGDTGKDEDNACVGRGLWVLLFLGIALAYHTAESREHPWPEAARSTVATGRTRKHTRARHARNRAFNSAKANMCSAIWPSISSFVGVQ